MAYEQKNNTGSLFKNDKREKDTHANARGSALIDGVRYWIDSWTNEDRNGNKYQSLKFKRADERATEIRKEAESKISKGGFSELIDDDLNDLPF